MNNPFAGRLAHELTEGWQVIARPNQRPPPGDWSIWMLLAGRGFGKTQWLGASGQYGRLAIVAATAADARDVMVEGESGILECAPDWCRPAYQSTRRRLEWPNGALAYLYSAEEPERRKRSVSGPLRRRRGWCRAVASSRAGVRQCAGRDDRRCGRAHRRGSAAD